MRKFLARRSLIAFFALFATQVVFALCNLRVFGISDPMEWLRIAAISFFGYCLTSTLLFLLPFYIFMLLPLKCRWNKGYRVVAEFFYFVPMLVALFANVSDAIYFQFTYRRLNTSILGYLTIGGDMGTLWPKFLIDYWYGTVSGVTIIALFIIFAARTKFPKRPETQKRKYMGIIGIIVIALFAFTGMHEHQHHPADHIQPKNSSLVDNSLYSIIRTTIYKDTKNLNLIDIDTKGKIVNPNFTSLQVEDSIADSNRWYAGAGIIDSTRRQNVVFIILESFSQEYMGSYNNGVMESYTPFLDSLYEHSVTFDGHSNGKESIESIPAVLASIPSLFDECYIMSPYFEKPLPSALPSILKSNGYHTAFFHGSYNGSMKFDQFCEKAGIKEYYGKNEYLAQRDKNLKEKDQDGFWGVYDEPFLQYMVRQMNTFKEPFFSTVFTISSHHPYSIPPQHEGRFKEGSHPLLQCVMYADYALQKFFDAAKQQPWYENTMFVILADHPGQGLHSQYNGYDGWYHIPMMFYSPRNPQPLHSKDIVQQIDLMPTIIDYLGIQTNIPCFGNSVFQRTADDHGWQIAYGNRYHQLLRRTKDGSTQVSTLTNNKGEGPDAQFLQAFLTQYYWSLVNSEL
ncbi:MAG: LTA synthase family protein [Bacteroidales bacterium]|nr:LTA synthase family protein [Candidatus Colimorpha pelethequi]